MTTTALIPSDRSGAAPDRGGEVRPDDVVPIRRPGIAPFRILLFGGGALAGWGLLDHDRGLPGSIADRLAYASGRGVDLDVIVDLDPMTPGAHAVLRRLNIARYDAVIVLPGESQSLAHVGRGAWADQMGTLVHTVRTLAFPQAPVVVVDSLRSMIAVSTTGFTRMRAQSGAGRLTAVTRALCGASDVRFLELEAPATVLDFGRQFSAKDFRRWAVAVTECLLPALDACAHAAAGRSAPPIDDRIEDETARQQALDAMALSGLVRNGLLDGIAQQARKLYGGTVGAVNIVDHDLVWQYASSRALRVELARDDSFCTDTIRSDAIHLVADTSTDPRFDGEIPDLDGDPVGFYVGEPIRSVDGYRIGALCVIDSEPRDADPARFTQLHDLAGRVERELWAVTRRR
jgi:GAF domain-containing protein